MPSVEGLGKAIQRDGFGCLQNFMNWFRVLHIAGKDISK